MRVTVDLKKLDPPAALFDRASAGTPELEG